MRIAIRVVRFRLTVLVVLNLRTNMLFQLRQTIILTARNGARRCNHCVDSAREDDTCRPYEQQHRHNQRLPVASQYILSHGHVGESLDFQNCSEMKKRLDFNPIPLCSPHVVGRWTVVTPCPTEMNNKWYFSYLKK